MSSRPQTYRQRAACIAAFGALFASPSTLPVPPFLVAKGRAEYLPKQERYLAARKAHRVSIAAASAAERALAKGKLAFAEALRSWKYTVQDEDNYPLTRELADLFGIAPSKIARAPAEEMLEITSTLREDLEQLPHLSGDPDELAALYRKREGLTALLSAFKLAEYAQKLASEESERAVAGFDDAWAALAALVEATSTELALQVIPGYRAGQAPKPRKSGKPGASKPSAEAPKPPSAAPEPPCAAEGKDPPTADAAGKDVADPEASAA